MIISVVAWINMLHWKYGLVEVISALVVNGFPLDAILRLTIEYYEAPFLSRNDKTQHALSIMGHTILTSIITSMLMCLPFIHCEMAFIGK